MAATTDPGKAWTTFLVITGYLLLRVLWALFVPSGSWPLSPTHFLAMAIDFGLVLGMVGTRRQLLAVLPQNDSRRTLAGVMFAAGIMGGICMFLIRISSDHGWWTGRLRDG
jgi:hypothetical protein